MFYFYVALVLIMNTVTFLLMWRDKKLARQRRERIPERVLLLCAALFGSVGGCLAMYLFRHKTRHMKFALGLPLLLLLHVYLTLLLIEKRIIRLPF